MSNFGESGRLACDVRARMYGGRKKNGSLGDREWVDECVEFGCDDGYAVMLEDNYVNILIFV